MMNWLTAVQQNKRTTSMRDIEQRKKIVNRMVPIGRGDWLLAGCLITIWLLVLLIVPAYLHIQLASWLTFVALLITPGLLFS